MKHTRGMQFDAAARSIMPTGSFAAIPRTSAGGVRASHILARIIFLITFGSTLAHASTPSISSYMDCARAIGVAINDKFAIVPGERSGDKGLYVYTDRSAFFLALGAPGVEDSEAREFFLKTNVSDVGDIFLVFREKQPRNKADIQTAISYQTTAPSKGVLGNYRVTPANDSLGEHAMDVFSKRLKEKVATIRYFIDSKNSYSTPREAKVAYESDRVIYRARLDRCRLEGDRDLTFAVAEEARKLESEFPGITIWEKQIGGNSPTARVR
jgi:hypothetical protein